MYTNNSKQSQQVVFIYVCICVYMVILIGGEGAVNLKVNEGDCRKEKGGKEVRDEEMMQLCLVFKSYKQQIHANS